MRIGFDATPMLAAWGGIRRYTESLLHGLIRIDEEHAYVLFGRPCEGAVKLPLTRHRWSGLDFPYKRLLDPVYLPGASGNIDLFHGTNYSAPLFGRYPRVVTVHDLTVQLLPHTHPRARRWKHRLLGPICRRATRVITDSCNTRDDLCRHLGIPTEKIDVIHLAADPSFSPVRCERELEEVRARYGLPRRFLLFVGAVEPRKNLPELIGALSLLAKRGRGLPLVIAGAAVPEERRAIEARASHEGLEIGSDVVLAGFVAESDLPALYSLCELFVYPSLYEGFGLPPLEAMACGAPVALSHNSSLGEVFEKCSFRIDWSSCEAAADALEVALGDSSRRHEMIARGLEQAAQRTWDDVARETLASYRRALEAL